MTSELPDAVRAAPWMPVGGAAIFASSAYSAHREARLRWAAAAAGGA